MIFLEHAEHSLPPKGRSGLRPDLGILHNLPGVSLGTPFKAAPQVPQTALDGFLAL